MNTAELLAIAFALAMDAFSVAIASGAGMKKVSMRQTFRLAWHFGLFQAIMPLTGWFAGKSIHGFVGAVDHWVAFILLAFVGTNMIRTVFSEKNEDGKTGKKDPTKGKILIMLSVATSIDALAVGFSMSMAGVDIIVPAIVIGLVALVFTAAGLHIGKKIVQLPRIGSFAELIGGVTLIAIGIRILFEHGVFAF